MLETLLGGAIGGLLRLAPEAFKLWDRKNERAHELAMLDKQIAADKLRGEQAAEKAQIEGDAARDVEGMKALTEALKGQFTPPPVTPSKWLNFWNGVNISVRPVITYTLVTLYTYMKVVASLALWEIHVSALTIAQTVYTEDDRAILWGCLNFYFLNRVFATAKKK